MSFEQVAPGAKATAKLERAERFPEIDAALRTLETAELRLRGVDARIRAFPSAEGIAEKWREIGNVAHVAVLDSIPGYGSFRVFVLNTIRENTGMKWTVPPYKPHGMSDVFDAIRDWQKVRAEVAAGNAPLLTERDQLQQIYDDASKAFQGLIAALNEDELTKLMENAQAIHGA